MAGVTCDCAVLAIVMVDTALDTGFFMFRHLDRFLGTYKPGNFSLAGNTEVGRTGRPNVCMMVPVFTRRS